MQCLAATHSFVEYFMTGAYVDEINRTNRFGMQGQLAEIVAELIAEMKGTTKASIAPRAFRDAIWRFKPQFRGHDQQDAQEFLGYLLDGLHEDLNLVKKRVPVPQVTKEREEEIERLPEIVVADQEWKVYRDRNDSVVCDFFDGQLRNKMECHVCGKTSTTFNAFQSLSLPIPTPSRQHPTITLHDCINEFLREETLEGENAWNCPRCRRPQPTSKCLSLTRLPQSIIIHLKRFSSFDAVSEKAETPVVFPLTGLEMGDLLPPAVEGVELNLDHDEATCYRLYGVVNHHRDSHGGLDSGHYTAMVRNDQGNWFDIGDDEVRQISEKKVMGAARSAYMLWYESYS
ncbi:hypothetical protein MNV49_000654 [Pseudohyphozyma bogoriensis]|nr:hypothetical protein MNV49_000654 [Pseudohyphozyma bogoriensis]